MSTDISVVIATHNQRARLRLVLCGLACQHFPKERFEIIVVDDGCTDGTDAMLAAEYPEVHVVPMRPNVGRCRARNAGVEQARGQFGGLSRRRRLAPSRLVGAPVGRVGTRGMPALFVRLHV